MDERQATLKLLVVDDAGKGTRVRFDPATTVQAANAQLEASTGQGEAGVETMGR